MCNIISCCLKCGQNYWFWRQKRYGQTRVECLNIFKPYEWGYGVSLEALESVLLSINPWFTDNYHLKILLPMVYSSDIDVGVVKALQELPRANHSLAYELFFSTIEQVNMKNSSSVTNPLHGQSNIEEISFDNDFFTDKEIGFILRAGSIPHISVLWSSAFGTARYRWLAKYHLIVESVSDIFTSLLLSTDWSKSTIPEEIFLDFIPLFKREKRSIGPTCGIPFIISHDSTICETDILVHNGHHYE